MPTNLVSERAHAYVALAQPASAASQSPWQGGFAPSRVEFEQQNRSLKAGELPLLHE